MISDGRSWTNYSPNGKEGPKAAETFFRSVAEHVSPASVPPSYSTRGSLRMPDVRVRDSEGRTKLPAMVTM